MKNKSIAIFELFFIFSFFYCCGRETVVQKEEVEVVEEVETNKVFITEETTDISNKIRVLILPLENKTDTRKYPASETIKSIILGSLYDFLRVVPGLDIPEKSVLTEMKADFLNRRNITPEEIYSNYNAEVIIYGDYIQERKSKKQVALINFKIWTKTKGQVETIKYTSPVDADIFDTIDDMIAKVIKLTMNEELKIAFLKFGDFRINEGNYYLLISGKIVSKITNDDFNLSLKILAGTEYTVKLKNLHNGNTVLDTKVILKPGEMTNISHIAKGSIRCIMTNKSSDEDFKIFLDEKEIALDEIYSDIPAERIIRIRVTNITKKDSYTLDYYLSDGEMKEFILPKARMVLDFSPQINSEGPGAKVTYSVSDDYKLMGKKSFVFYFFVPYLSWANVMLTFPSGIDWSNFNTIKFLIYGRKSQNMFSIYLLDKYNETFVYYLRDSWNGWRQVSIPFKKFRFRTDYQFPNAKINGRKDYPLTSCIIEISSVNSGNVTAKLVINEIEITRE
ncbi:MAG: carbohydrate binding domain-containing protein [Brevinematia bacterium]